MAPRTVRWNKKTGTGWRQVQTGPNKGKWQKYRNFKPLGNPQRNIHLGSGLVKAISKSKQTMERLDADRDAFDQSRKTQSPTIKKREKVGRGSYKTTEVPNPEYREKDSSPGGDRDQDRIIDVKSDVVQKAIKEQEKLKITTLDRWQKAMGSEVFQMDSGGKRIGGPGTISSSEKEDQNKQNAGISSTTPKKETNQDKIAKLQQRIDRGGMMMKRGQLKRRLERQIKELREKEKNVNSGGTGTAFPSNYVA